jgi:ATP-dependent helicase/nuclease subunit A
VNVPSDQPARDRIHNDLDATLFVEAGAGTGKTRELIERILRLVLTGRAQMRWIAAITFTESAATELRDRLRIKLEEASRNASGLSAEERARCEQALRDVDAAAIETLHAFAQRILSDHPLEARLPPILDLQDDIRASIAFDERWADFLDQLLDDAELEQPLLQAFTLGVKPEQLRTIAWQFHQHWDRLELTDLAVPPLAAIDAEPVLAALQAACDLRRYCTDHDDALFHHLETLDGYRARLAAARDDLDRLRILSERTPIKRSNVGQLKHWRSFTPADIRHQLVEAHDLRESVVNEAKANILPPLVAALRRLVLAYADDRRRQGRLEFHDLLVQARDLLRRDASVRRRVRAKYSHLLIDEFQDTDPLQIEIAVLIAGAETEGEPPPWHEASVEDGRLFFVGDPKQSIYRFRRADIALYQRAQRLFSQQTVRLTQNFRSLPPVIDWVNHVFGELIGTEDKEGQAPYVALAASREESGVSVRVLGAPMEGLIGVVRQKEAAEIVQLIRSAKEQRWPVTEAGLDGEPVSRDARYADIAILMPARTTLPPIEDALEAAGIPYRVESRSLVYDTQEVRDLLSILRAVDDPTDQVALIAALRSPAFACGDDDLLRFARAGGHWDYRRDAPDGLTKDDPVREAFVALHDLHEQRWWLAISGLVEKVIRERRLFELAFVHRRPRSRWQRLRFVLDQARAFEESGGRTLRQFIGWAERQADEGTRVVETVVPEPDDDAVRIMTIHAAKGLEFPIVFLAGLNLGVRGQGQEQGVLWDEYGLPEVQLGSGFASSGHERLSAIEEMMEQYEKVRLLYVAATRARDHLVVSLYHKPDQECHARHLLEICLRQPELWSPSEPAPPRAAANGAAPAAFGDSAERRQAWLDERAQRIDRLARAPWRSATEIAQRLAGSDGDPNLRKEPPAEEVPPWRRGRAGTAIGRAVHAVLQSIDLASGDGIESAARAQAAAEGIADRAEEVARMARAALEAPSVRAAVAGGRYWRELYVAAPIEGITLEGFIDLLAEGPDGLVIIDYKTDAVPGERELAEALARYRLQGAAYALAAQEALGRPVTRCVFVFTKEREAQERAVEDLAGTIEDVRAELRRVAAPAG